MSIILMPKHSKTLFALSAIALTPIAIGLSQAPASAVALTWDLNNFNFRGGGQATGSFAYDATTNQLTNWNITTTDGNIAGFNYTTSNSRVNAGLFGTLSDRLFSFTTGSRAFAFLLPSELPATTNALVTSRGVTAAAEGFGNLRFTLAGGLNFQAGGRVASSGATVVNNVPEPEDTLAIGASLGFFWLLGKRYYKKSKVKSLSKV
ncbi:hypothetical protein L6494_04160 [Nostoc sp. UHCC 0870]|uniref:hypothetical protein n=2 Tax=Nostoc sp. UHCC 0870 TaxID=2914041 RepID=UPI001EE083CB|nr:hypothetical protein [Nostoc sp. UHCC 0870]UKO98935.1 hypothetical protein L6494_04160 [Nostoc sp. UHCC 0870]